VGEAVKSVEGVAAVFAVAGSAPTLRLSAMKGAGDAVRIGDDSVR
jgi:hypothetical protein